MIIKKIPRQRNIFKTHPRINNFFEKITVSDADMVLGIK
jgi:hypothetical protein